MRKACNIGSRAFVSIHIGIFVNPVSCREIDLVLEAPKMRRPIHLGVAVSVGVFVLLSAVTAQEEQWLQYHSANEAWQIVGDMGSSHASLKSEKPEGVHLRQFKCGEPLFARWETPMVEAGGLYIAFDRKNEQGPYDLLYVDSDADGDLSDESVYEPYRQDQRRTYFGPAKIIFEGEDGPITYHINVTFYDYGDRRYLYIRPAGWYEGTVTVAGQKKHCVLIDQNVNGTFNDKSVNASQCDRIRIGKKDSRDTRFVGKYIEVEGALHELEVAQDGAYIKLAKAEDVTFGNVRLPEAITEFAAGGENGLFILKLEKGLGKLPVGTYRIDHWAIDREDEKGRDWKLQGRYFSGDRGLFTVAETSEVELPSVGEPIISSLQARAQESRYYFSQDLQGQLGERIELTREGARPHAPKLHIKSKDGTYDRTFSFEYG